MTEQFFRARRVVTPRGTVAASLHVRDGRIARVAHYDDVPAGATVVDAGDAVIMPGTVDTHVHINEPGRTEWEGFETATRAAAAGGTTTLVDMPLNSIPPATSEAGLLEKAAVMEGRCWVDVGLWGGAVPANTRRDPQGLARIFRRGALGFKGFLVPSGVDEFPYLHEADLRAALAQVHGTEAVFMVHAELPGPIDDAARAMSREDPPPDPRVYRNYVRSRPREAEDQAIELLYRLCKEFGTPVHVVHLSSSGALGTLARARDEGLALTAETAPHYLHFAAEDVPDGATWFKCAPPIRERENQERLWAALDDGLINMVVSDHSPCTPDLKRIDTGDFAQAWGGIAGLQFARSALWTSARARGFSLDRLAQWTSAAPAKHANISDRKGSLAPGRDADLVFFDPEASFVVEPPAVLHRHKVTPYQGETLYGVVRRTFVRGVEVFSGEAPAPTAHGRWITHP